MLDLAEEVGLLLALVGLSIGSVIFYVRLDMLLAEMQAISKADAESKAGATEVAGGFASISYHIAGRAPDQLKHTWPTGPR